MFKFLIHLISSRITVIDDLGLNNSAFNNIRQTLTPMDTPIDFIKNPQQGDLQNLLIPLNNTNNTTTDTNPQQLIVNPPITIDPNNFKPDDFNSKITDNNSNKDHKSKTETNNLNSKTENTTTPYLSNKNDNSPNTSTKLPNKDKNKKDNNKNDKDKNDKDNKESKRKHKPVTKDKDNSISPKFSNKKSNNKKPKKNNKKLKFNFDEPSSSEESNKNITLDPEDIKISLSPSSESTLDDTFDIHKNSKYKDILQDQLDDSYDKPDKLHKFNELDNIHNWSLENADNTKQTYLEKKLNNVNAKVKYTSHMHKKLKDLHEILNNNYDKVSDTIAVLKKKVSQNEGELDTLKTNIQEIKGTLKEVQGKERLTENEIYNLTKKITQEKDNLSKIKDQSSLINKQIKENERKRDDLMQELTIHEAKIEDYEKIRKYIGNDKCSVQQKMGEIHKKMVDNERAKSKLKIQKIGISGDGYIPLYAQY
ncbi:hypothetical protein A0H76_2320 [Hepatospora eriocheir]|uniref:Uncharacterized protein n=1 Tax=Hepatospora eriocheir TaxID=1081669 RepID=A0A1X0QK23_9MICR|nr:hypothetical protein A0H76_2320 [Hepatospora eriocheir]